MACPTPVRQRGVGYSIARSILPQKRVGSSEGRHSLAVYSLGAPGQDDRAAGVGPPDERHQRVDEIVFIEPIPLVARIMYRRKNRELVGRAIKLLAETTSAAESAR